MTSPRKSFEDRRIDHERRLRYAVKKAHDPVFAPPAQKDPKTPVPPVPGTRGL
jgi:hypothetical protein